MLLLPLGEVQSLLVAKVQMAEVEEVEPVKVVKLLFRFGRQRIVLVKKVNLHQHWLFVVD